MDLAFYPLRFRFTALESIYFPPGKPGNILRGALGTIFRKIACAPTCTDAHTCEERAACPYAALFEPEATGRGPSGLKDWPRPFVFRARHLDGRTVAPDQDFHFDVNLFEMRSPALAYLALTFAELAREGLGPGRGRAKMDSVDLLHLDGVEATRVHDGSTPPAPARLPLESNGASLDRVRVDFLSPTELKAGQRLVERPDFDVLFGRIRDRISTLRALYGEGPLAIDFKGMGERAARVRMTRCEVHHQQVERRSTRTGQSHSIGGFVGLAEYEGELGEFLPYLQAAHWTGVGRQTVWGKGEIETSVT